MRQRPKLPRQKALVALGPTFWREGVPLFVDVSAYQGSNIEHSIEMLYSAYGPEAHPSLIWGELEPQRLRMASPTLPPWSRRHSSARPFGGVSSSQAIEIWNPTIKVT